MHINGEKGKDIKVLGKQTRIKEKDHESNCDCTVADNTKNKMDEPDLVEVKDNTKDVEEMQIDEEKTDIFEKEIYNENILVNKSKDDKAITAAKDIDIKEGFITEIEKEIVELKAEKFQSNKLLDKYKKILYTMDQEIKILKGRK